MHTRAVVRAIHTYNMSCCSMSLVVHVRSGEKEEAVGETGCGEMVSVAAAMSERKHQCSRLYTNGS
jgi:hypothetical protein